MTTQRHYGAAPLQPHELERLLKRRLRYGLRASRLLDCPELIEFLCPEVEDPSRGLYDRALVAEGRIAEAVERIGGKPAQALRVLFGLDDGTVGLSLQERRKLAGQILARKARLVSEVTFAKNYEKILIRDLNVELWRASQASDT